MARLVAVRYTLASSVYGAAAGAALFLDDVAAADWVARMARVYADQFAYIGADSVDGDDTAGIDRAALQAAVQDNYRPRDERREIDVDSLYDDLVTTRLEHGVVDPRAVDGLDGALQTASVPSRARRAIVRAYRLAVASRP